MDDHYSLHPLPPRSIGRHFFLDFLDAMVSEKYDRVTMTTESRMNQSAKFTW
jgi:hypothetical protein